jgi:regulator of protease activity HflC (stomatin/prohibitin superfamily)
MEDQSILSTILSIICCISIPITFMVITIFSTFIQIIPEYQKAVTVQRKNCEGNTAKVHNPGILFINRLTTKLFKVDMQIKEKITEVEAISKPDNIKIKIQTQWAYKVVDPVKSISLESIDMAMEGMAKVVLREIIQELSIESMQKEQIQIEKKWYERVNDLMENRWGVKVLNLEIQKITRVTLEIV